MHKSELIFSLLEEALKLGVCEKRNGHNVSAPVLSDVDCKVAFGHVDREAGEIVAAVFLAEARTSLEDLFEDCGLGHFV